MTEKHIPPHKCNKKHKCNSCGEKKCGTRQCRTICKSTEERKCHKNCNECNHESEGEGK